LLNSQRRFQIQTAFARLRQAAIAAMSVARDLSPVCSS
jgi:hypothetical protein